MTENDNARKVPRQPNAFVMSVTIKGVIPLSVAATTMHKMLS